MHARRWLALKRERRNVGRQPQLSPHQQREAIARREAGETLSDIARSYGVSHHITRLTDKLAGRGRRCQSLNK
jgi:hypothetical protein